MPVLRPNAEHTAKTRFERRSNIRDLRNHAVCLRYAL
jgi:hypothetical protein